MNWSQFQRNVGALVELEPIACRVDANNQELPEVSHDWRIQSISADGVVDLENITTAHVAILGKDHIYDFRSNPSRSRSGQPYAFLVLKVQIFTRGAELWYRPNSRPGERVDHQYRPQARTSHTMAYLVEELAKSGGWTGRPSEFNRHAVALLYGAHAAGVLASPPDYLSALLVNDHVYISSITDVGNLPDGSPDTTISILPYSASAAGQGA